MYKKFREWKTSKTLIKALHSGALAWIEGREIPDVAELTLPSTTMGQLVRKAYVEQVHFLAEGTGLWIHSEPLSPGAHRRKSTYLVQRSGSKTSNRRGSDHLQHTLGGVALHDLPSKMVGIIPFQFTQVTSRGRLKPKQASGLYPTQIQSPEFRVVVVIAAVPFWEPMLRHVLAYSS
jgi:hypothetical protein